MKNKIKKYSNKFNFFKFLFLKRKFVDFKDKTKIILLIK